MHGPWIRSQERNDCGVVALANVAEISYQQAYAIAKASGRRARCRSYADRVMNAARKHGIVVGKLALKRRTLATFVRQWNTGHYYVRVGGHMVAVVNGTIADGTRGTRIVTHVYAVRPAGGRLALHP